MAEKILIIDDDLDTLNLVDLVLKREGYQTVSANNGMQGLLKMSEESPDLVLLDVMMPDMDGYEVARRLRNNPDTTDIPILMFTSKAQVDDKATGFEAGADTYLTKPTKPETLQEQVKILLLRTEKAKEDSVPQQHTQSEKAEKEKLHGQSNRSHPDDIVSARFADWFKNKPPKR